MDNNSPVQTSPPPVPQVPVAPAQNLPRTSSTTMWDAFEHILMFISLYVMATSIVLTLNFFIDKWYPGVTTQSYSSYSSSADTYQLAFLRGYLASLIVSFPLYAFFFINTTKRTMVNPNLRNIKSRKILIYLTLVITFIIMLINIISLVYKLLSGDVNLNFLLHLGAISLVSGVVFIYYIFQVLGDKKIVNA